MPSTRMAHTSLFRRRRAQTSASEQSSALSTSKSSVEGGLPFLWSWPANANRSKLSDITLAHVLSGDTVSPISLSDFEAFLAFCDISLENLQFIAWYQDYRARFEALAPEQQTRSPSPRMTETKPLNILSSTAVLHSAPSTSTFISAEYSHVRRMESVDSDSSLEQETSGAQSFKCFAGAVSPLVLGMSAAASPPSSQTPLNLAPEYHRSGSEVSGNDDPTQNFDLRSFYSFTGGAGSPPTISCASGSESTFRAPSSHPSETPLIAPYPPAQNRLVHPSAQPFRDEVQNILATFFVPGSKKELSLSAEMRGNVIKESAQTTHPDVFFPVYEAIYETTECISLPRFLVSASTNINRPRQLFWYFSALPTFLLGVAIALLLILSPSRHLVLPPQSHRAWRLLIVPCFLLSSMMWYKGFRGFCPILFLRSSRQLRAWELESMVDDEEAQAYCVSLSTDTAGTVKAEGANGHPLTPISPKSSSSPLTRIAPFLDDVDTIKKEEGVNSDSSCDAASAPSPTSDYAAFKSARMDEQSRSRTRNGFHRPPIFGPGRVIEDKRIRAVHMYLWWSLVRFGLFWAVVSAVIVVSVPSLH